MAKDKKNVTVDNEVDTAVSQNNQATATTTTLDTEASALPPTPQEPAPADGDSAARNSEGDTSMDTEDKAEATETQGDNIVASFVQVVVRTERNRIAEEVFATNAVDVLYFTADLIPFAEQENALQHAQWLDNKTVVTVRRGE